MQWPGLTPIDHNVWSQTNNPATEAVANYLPIDMQFASAGDIVGLGPCSSSNALVSAPNQTRTVCS
jgi:hypothetical protein